MGGPEMAPHTPQRSHAPRGTRGAARRQARTAYLFLAPGLLLFVVFRVYPLLEGLRLSFTNARLGRPSLAYVGAANYTRLLDDTRFHVSLANTAFYTIASTLPILVIYLAGLQDIPRDLYEAAALDGAGSVRRFWAITLPLLRPVLLFVVVTHIIGSFQLFGQVFVLTGGGPGDATRTVVQHLYEAAFQNFFQFGAASAMAWVLFAIILVFSILQFRLLRGHTEY